MGTPKMDGSVEPNSWLGERTEKQRQPARRGEFVCGCRQTGIEDRHHETMCRVYGDDNTKGGVQRTFNATVCQRKVSILLLTCDFEHDVFCKFTHDLIIIT